MTSIPRTYAEVDGFITMLMAACEDSSMNETLEMLLSQPDERRRIVVRRLLDRLRQRAAPQRLIDAMTCLLDDNVAEQAYQVIFQCARELRK